MVTSPHTCPATLVSLQQGRMLQHNVSKTVTSTQQPLPAQIIQDVVDQPSIVSQVADVVPKLYAAGRQLHPSTCGDVMQSLLGANQARCCTHCIGCKHPPPYAAQPAAALDLALKVLDVPLPPPPPTSVAASALQAMAGSAHITPATSVAAAAALEALAGTVVPLTATSEGYSAQSLASALLTVAVNHAVHSGDPAVMTQLLDSMQRRDAAPPYSALAALVLVRHCRACPTMIITCDSFDVAAFDAAVCLLHVLLLLC